MEGGRAAVFSDEVRDGVAGGVGVPTGEGFEVEVDLDAVGFGGLEEGGEGAIGEGIGAPPGGAEDADAGFAELSHVRRERFGVIDAVATEFGVKVSADVIATGEGARGFIADGDRVVPVGVVSVGGGVAVPGVVEGDRIGGGGLCSLCRAEEQQTGEDSDERGQG